MKTAIKLLAVLAVLQALSFNANAAAVCANPGEKVAIDTRVLQTGLMVGALSCNESQRYNDFMNKHKTYLSNEGLALRSYFSRAYGSAGESKLNKFLTAVANDVSTASMNMNGGYCDSVKKAFDAVESAESGQIHTASAAIAISDANAIPACDGQEIARR